MTSKLLIDTNVLLDCFIPDRPGSGAARRLISLCDVGKFEGLACAGSFKDLYYVSCKYLDEPVVRDVVRNLMALLTVVPLDKLTCADAIDSNEPDFEDGLICSAAEMACADFIITRDASAFRLSKIRSLTASDFLAIFDDGWSGEEA